jgi:hypothetical protein
MLHVQGVSGGIVDILGDGSINKFIKTCVRFSMGVEIQLFEVGTHVCRLAVK